MRYPLVKQTGLKDCGPCSLASIIIYYKGYLSVDTLSEMMHTTKNGTTAYDLIETAKKIGFKSEGKKITFNDLNKINLPCIVHVTLSNTYNHFMIIYKIDYQNKRLLIGDPSDKVKYMSFNEFNQIWNNIVIELAPLRKLICSKPDSLFKYLHDILKTHKNKYLLLLILSFVFIILSAIYSLFIKYLIDNINIFSISTIIIFLIIYILRIIILILKNNLMIKNYRNISLLLTNRIIKSLILLPYPYYRNHTTGEIISRFNDTEYIKSTINEVINIIIDIPFIIFILIIMFHLNDSIFLIIISFLCLYFLFNYFISLKLKKYISHYYNSKASFNSLLTEYIEGFETVKGLNIENDIIFKLKNSYSNLEDVIYKHQKIYNYKEIILDLITSIGSFTIICIGFSLYKTNNITIGSIILLYMLFNYLLDPLTNLLNFFIKYKESSNICYNIQNITNSKFNRKVPINNYDIEIKNLTYRIGLKNILKNINLKIKHGEKVFITGPSGSGKSTLVKLIKGYYKTKRIYIDNQNNYDNNLILYISQNEYLFTDTIYNNLMTNRDTKDIVKMCLVNKDLSDYVEENGFNLSGGEKERIVLARTLLRDFEILIIDEGLQEIDVNKERKILKNIFNTYKDKTIIVISHRLENIDLYDRFIEISDGKVVNNLDKHFN